MTILELQKRLQEMYERYGDVEVVIESLKKSISYREQMISKRQRSSSRQETEI